MAVEYNTNSSLMLGILLIVQEEEQDRRVERVQWREPETTDLGCRRTTSSTTIIDVLTYFS
jgi:hypothetical protein